MTAEQIKATVNAAFAGVDKSVVGPIFTYPENDILNRQMNQLAFGTFTIVLTGLMRNIGDEKCGNT
jgi:hypothetical protein